MNQQQRIVDRDFDTWRDSGQLLALLLLPLVALAFRRGWLLTIGLVGIVGVTTPSDSYAFEWRDLWLRSDQQGLIELHEGDPAAAAAEFESYDWRGTAHYRGENYSAAAEAFAQGQSATDHYNRGNALAKAGKLQEALYAYEAALEKSPEFDDAEFNAELVRKLLEQQQQQQQQQQSGQDPQSQNAQQPQSAQDESQQGGSQQEQSQGQQDQQQQQAPGEQQNQQPQSPSGADGESSKQPEVNEEAAQALADRQAESEDGDQQEREGQLSEQMQTAESEQREVQGQQPSERENSEDAEQQQALEQWLRQVPDDPSGLMRRKFEYEHRRMRQQYRRGEWLPPENEAYRRW